jgi:Fur family transcriptional regulator, ferric uptake regulator
MKNRETNQRSIILEELRKVTTHPTASDIYEMVKKVLPRVGLATVYRNLDFLEKKGEIIRLKFNFQKSRYDGNIEGHAHLVCKCCGKVTDIFDVADIKIKSEQLRNSGFKPTLEFIEIPGLCKKCNKIYR